MQNSRPNGDGGATVGIDLAADPRRTSACTLRWTRGGIAVEFLPFADDEALFDLIRGSRKVGLDCPVGWPRDFVTFVAAHSEQTRLPAVSAFEPARNGRSLDPLVHRLTDHLTWVTSGMRPPLSVSTNLLGVVALRAARLLDRLDAAGVPVDWSGAGVVAEVYPAAALNRWGIADPESYKKPEAHAVRARIIERLEAGLGARFSPLVRERCIVRHDDLDAVICALVARSVELGHTIWPATADELEHARTEGWIHVPTGPLAGLRPA